MPAACILRIASMAAISGGTEMMSRCAQPSSWTVAFPSGPSLSAFCARNLHAATFHCSCYSHCCSEDVAIGFERDLKTLTALACLLREALVTWLLRAKV